MGLLSSLKSCLILSIIIFSMGNFKSLLSLLALMLQGVLMDGVLLGKLGSRMMKMMEDMKSIFVLNTLTDPSKKPVAHWFMK